VIIWEKFKRWFDRPFEADGSAINWLLFIGLLVIALFFWSRVVARIG
jgi:hypothetical protein